MMKPVIDYDNYRRGTLENKKPDGFWFDMNQFENLIDAWTTQEDILTILQVSREEMDKFCMECYSKNFDHTYRILKQISLMFFRKSMTYLAKEGNSSALVLAAKHFADMKDDTNGGNINITFKNDLPEDK